MSRWSCPELARHAVAEGICASISTATVRRWMSEDALKPWHTPVHASWLNQIEIYFSIVQRKVVSPNDFTDLDTVIDRLSAFEAR
jgi:hypothetical protein